MLTIVLDSTVFVSAFLTPNGAAEALIQHAQARRVLVSTSEAILTETRCVLGYPHLMTQYRYSAQDVYHFSTRIGAASILVTPLPPFPAICRDPNDDMVLACAKVAAVMYLVTRDKDLLVLEQYDGIQIVPPETLLTLLRSRGT